MIDILTALLFMVPVGIANSSPVWMRKLPVLKNYNYPLDCGIEIRGKRLFGQNKSWRGLIVGILTAIIVWIPLNSFLQNVESELIQDVYAPFISVNPLIFSALAGTGAIMGDAIESMIKRQLDRPPGTMFFPWDQLDYLFGGIIFTSIVLDLSNAIYFWVLVLGVTMHLMTNIIAYKLGVKDVPY